MKKEEIYISIDLSMSIIFTVYVILFIVLSWDAPPESG